MSNKILWHFEGWEDYLYWQKTDSKMLARINQLIKEIQRDPFQGIGKPEPLKHNWVGFWSRRINREHRIIYTIEKEVLIIAQCRYHY